MRFKTKIDLVTAIETAIYQSAGSQVQVYSQDILAGMVQRAFDYFFLKKYWSYFRKREERTLNGTTGQITAVLTHIAHYEDIQAVFHESSRRPIPKLPHMFNTLNMSGALPRFIEASGDTKLFKLYPLTSTGDILVIGRRRPDEYAMDEEVEFDDTCIINYACWDYFVDDGANPAAASKHQGLWESRLRELELADEQHAIPLDGHNTAIPQDWYYA